MYNLEQTIISQYANSAAINGIIAAANSALDPAINIEQFYSYFWNLATAQGFGLNNWGVILGVSRNLQIPNQSQYLGFEGVSGVAPFNVAPFYIGGSTFSLFPLPDPQYRTLLLAKAFANIMRCSIQNMNTLCQAVFGSGELCVLDLGSMQMAYVFNGIPSNVNLAIVENSGVFPHPTGVSMAVRSGLLFNAVLLAGASAFDIGFFPALSLGSLTPSNDANGNTIEALYSVISSANLVLAIGSSSSLTQSYFNTLTINGQSLAASAASFSSGGSTYTWQWPSESALAFVSGSTYSIMIS